MDTPLTKRPLWFRILRGLLVAVVVLCLLFGMGAWWLLGTASGAKWLVNRALPYMQVSLPDTLQLDVEHINADTLARLNIGKITLADKQGIWFEAEQITLRWEPSALLHATVYIKELSAKRVHFLRPPQGEDIPPVPLDEQIESFTTLPDTLLALSLPPLKIDSLVVSELAIDSELVNIPSRFRFSASADFTASPEELAFSLRSLEGIETRATAKLHNGSLHALWHEAAGGILGNMLMVHTPAPIDASIESAMKKGILHHSLNVQAGKTPLLTGMLGMPLSQESPLTLDVTLPQPALLAPLAQFSDALHISAALDKNTLTVDATTHRIIMGEGQSLAEATAKAQVAFENDPLFTVDATATATLQQSGAKDMPLRAHIAASGDAKQWEIRTLHLATPDIQATAQGEMDVATGVVQLDGKLLLPQLDADFEVSAQNIPHAPEASVKFALEQWKQPLPASLHKALDALLVTADYRATGNGHIQAKSNLLTLDSDYALAESALSLHSIRLTAGDDIYLNGDIMFDTSHSTATGMLKGAIKSTAPLQDAGWELPRIEASKGTFDIQLTAPSRTQQLAVAYNSGPIRIENTPAAKDLSLNANITLPKKQETQIHAKVKATALSQPLRLDSFAGEIEGSPALLNWKIVADHAATHTSLNAKGNLHSQEKTMTLTADRLVTKWQKNVLSLQQPAIVDYASDKIALRELKFGLNDTALLTANASLQENRVEGKAAIAKLPLNAIPLGNLGKAKGVVDANFSLNGSPDNPVAAWDITLGDLQHNYPKLAKLRQHPLTLSLRGGLQQQELTSELSVNAPAAESFAAANVSMPMDISLEPNNVRFRPKGPINADIKADLVLAPFLPLVMPDNIYGAGHLIADATIKGTLDNPSLKGLLTLHSGQIEILQAGTLIDDLAFKITADDDTITISEGSATDGAKGKLEFDGTIELDSTLPMDVQAKFADFIALRHQNATATVSGKSSLAGDLTDALLKGDLTINTAKILIQRTGDSVAELKVVEVESLNEPLAPPEKAEEKNNEKAKTHEQRRLERPFARNLALDVDIKADNQIFLDGFGLNAELKGMVKATGTAATPKLDGKMETVRGRWEFFGRTFAITQGEAILSEENLSAPLINIRAETEADDILAIAQISGSTNNPKIEFSSIPSLPKDEILSRVMFGRKLNNISPYQALQLADMLRSLSGSGSGGSLNPLSKLQDTLGIDELKINNESGDTENVTVGVGKYVRENVYLEVEGGAGENSGKVSLEVDLTPKISVETEARQNAESAVRLNYKYDY